MLKKRFGIKSWFLTGIQCSVGVAVIVISVLAAVVTSNGDTETAGEDLTAIVPLEKDVIASVSGERQEAASLMAEEEETEEYLDRKSTRLNSSHIQKSRMPSSA